MDTFLIEKIKEATPKINPLIANGIAVEHMKSSEEYIDSILRNVSKDFPEGLKYVNYERCSIQDEFMEVSKKRNNKRYYDIARSDIYMVKLFFTFKGQPMPPRHIFLPFVSSGATMMLSGTRYLISPVLTDKVISVGLNEVFVRLLRAKLKIHRTPQNVMFNGVKDEVQVIWSEIHNKNSEMKKLKSPVKAYTCLTHYLFCKYGFYETFTRFADCTPVVGEHEITEEAYPPDKWVICTSRRNRPKGAMRGPYNPSNLRVAIPIEQFTQKVKNLVAGLFYVADYFPQRITPQYIDLPSNWKVIMGLILFTDSYTFGKLHEDIEKHLRSLDQYIDVLVAVKLKDIGYDIKDVYELFSLIIGNFTDWIHKANDTINSMYDKELSVLYDVLYDITSSIFDMLFKLRAVTKKELTMDETIKLMNKHLKQRSIFHITKQRKGVSTVSSSGDNKYFKMTSVLVSQGSSNGRPSKTERKSVEDPQLQLHSSIAEVGSFLFLPKPDPSGHGRISPWVNIDASANIVRDPERRELIDEVQEMVARRIKSN